MLVVIHIESGELSLVKSVKNKRIVMETHHLKKWTLSLKVTKGKCDGLTLATRL